MGSSKITQKKRRIREKTGKILKTGHGIFSTPNSESASKTYLESVHGDIEP